MKKEKDRVVSPYLTKKGAATFLCCSERTIDNRRKEGAIPSIKRAGTVYFKKLDLLAYMEEGVK